MLLVTVFLLLDLKRISSLLFLTFYQRRLCCVLECRHSCGEMIFSLACQLCQRLNSKSSLCDVMFLAWKKGLKQFLSFLLYRIGYWNKVSYKVFWQMLDLDVLLLAQHPEMWMVLLICKFVTLLAFVSQGRINDVTWLP